MPIHDWSHVNAGIFHDFHHAWIEEIKRALNRQLLPHDYYALAEQRAGGYGPDVLTLQLRGDESAFVPTAESNGSSEVGVSLAPPPVQLTAETDSDFYRRKQSRVVVRHVSGDPIVAVVEIVSPGNKSGQNALHSFVSKSIDLLENDIQLLVVDVQPPGPRNPAGIHGAIWWDLCDEKYVLPTDRPLTVASYESNAGVRAYVEHFAIGSSLPEMPLFLGPGAHVMMPLKATYEAAFDALPRRWQAELMPR